MSQTYVIEGSVRVKDDVDNQFFVDMPIKSIFSSGTLKINHNRRVLTAGTSKDLISFVGLTTCNIVVIKSDYPISLELNDLSGTFTTIDIANVTFFCLKGTLTQIDVKAPADNDAVIEWVLGGN